MNLSPEPSHHRRDTFSLGRYPNAIKGLERLARNPSPFEPTLLKWELRDHDFFFAEWLSPPSRCLHRVLGHDPEFDLKRRVRFGQDILDYCLLTGERPSAKMTYKFAVDHNYRLHIPLEQVTGLGFYYHHGATITDFRLDWEDPLGIGDAYSVAAVLSTLLRGLSMNSHSPEHIARMHKCLEDFRDKKASLVYEPIAELSQGLNDILGSALSPDPAARITLFQDFRILYIEASKGLTTENHALKKSRASANSGLGSNAAASSSKAKPRSS